MLRNVEKTSQVFAKGYKWGFLPFDSENPLTRPFDKAQGMLFQRGN